jgi:CBS domain containing-hemolysin-like protein
LEIVFGYGEEDRSPDMGYEIQPDGSLLFQAQVPLVLVRSLLELPEDFFEQPQARQAENLADFLLSLAGHIPQKGEKIPYENYLFEIVEATPYRIDRVRAYRLVPGPDASPPEGLS